MPTKRILYIEDNFQNRRLVKKLLKMNGYDYLEAEDGLQGIAVAARERPDLILMDINLPGIDGMEATSRLKSSSDLSEIPIIALTAAAMRGDRERIMAAGCDGYLQKPINTTEVIETIRDFIGTSELPAQPSPAAQGTAPVVTETPKSPSPMQSSAQLHNSVAVASPVPNRPAEAVALVAAPEALVQSAPPQLTPELEVVNSSVEGVSALKSS